MPELTIIILFFVIICVMIAFGVWLIVTSKIKTDPANPESSNSLNVYVAGRRSMQLGDWLNSIILVIVGVFLGIAINGLVQLLTTAFWPIAVIIPFLFISLLLFDELIDRIVDRIFPSGVRPASKPQVTNRSPLLRLLSLPIGIIAGITLARFGLSDIFLRLIT